MNQPVPDVSQADVERVLARDFEREERERVAELLRDPESNFSSRVLLAVLKLSKRDVDAVAAQLETARLDWRDVVAYAEYPAYMQATSGSTSLDPGRRSELIQADWAQYEAWLQG